MIEIILSLILTAIVIRASLTIDNKKDKPKLVKKKRYFTKPNELGVYYEEDEKGKITKFEDGQHY